MLRKKTLPRERQVTMIAAELTGVPHATQKLRELLLHHPSLRRCRETR